MDRMMSGHHKPVPAGLAVLAVLLALVLAALACSPAPVNSITSVPINPQTPNNSATATTAGSASAQTEQPTGASTSTAQTTEAGVITADNAAQLATVRTISASSAWISGLSFSPVDHSVATFGLGRSVDIWNGDTGKLDRHLGTQGDWGLGLAFSPDGSHLVSGDSGGDVVVWDVKNGKSLATVVSPPQRVYDIEWSPDSQHFSVVGQGSSHLEVFGATGTKEKDIKTSSGWLWSTAWSKDFLAASNDTARTVYIYDTTSYGSAGSVTTPAPAGELDFSPDGKLLVGCFRTDGSLHIWDTSNWSEVKTWEAHPTKGNAQGCLAGDFSKDGSVYFTGGDDGNVNVWNIKTGERLKSVEYGKMVWKISVSGDGKLVAIGLDDGRVDILGLK